MPSDPAKIRVKTPAIARLLRVLKLGIFALVVWGLSKAIGDAYSEVGKSGIPWSQLRWNWLAAASSLFAAAQLPMAWFWQQLLRAMGIHVSFFAALRAFWIGHLGKYVPGKLLVVAIRTGLLHRPIGSTTLAVTSVFVETLTYMATGALLASLSLMAMYRGQWQMQMLCGMAVVGLGVFVSPPVLRRIVRRLSADQNLDDATRQVDWRLLLEGMTASLVSWTFNVLSLWAAINALPFVDFVPFSVSSAIRLTASLTVAVVAGFASLLPGGLGVREWVLDRLMFAEFGKATAISSAIVLRVAWLMTEILGSIILYAVPSSASPERDA